MAVDSPENLESDGPCPVQASPGRRSLLPVGSIDLKLGDQSSLSRSKYYFDLLLPPSFLESSSLGSREMSPVFLTGRSNLAYRLSYHVVFVPTGQLASPCAQLVAAECDIQDSGVYGLL